MGAVRRDPRKGEIPVRLLANNRLMISQRLRGSRKNISLMKKINKPKCSYNALAFIHIGGNL